MVSLINFFCLISKKHFSSKFFATSIRYFSLALASVIGLKSFSKDFWALLIILYDKMDSSFKDLFETIEKEKKLTDEIESQMKECISVAVKEVQSWK